MLRASFPIGRYFGVDIRVHVSFPLLLLLAAGFAYTADGGVGRGVALWLAICLAVGVRELARAIAAAYAGLDLRAIFLLPVGGVMVFSTQDARAPQPSTRLVYLTGPIANIFLGALLLGLAYAFEPHVSLLAQPWVSTGHILRSFVWTQFILGMVSLLPTPSVPSRSMLRSFAPKAGGTAETGEKAGRQSGAGGASGGAVPTGARGLLPAFGLGTGLALGLILAGFLLPNLILGMLGIFMLLGAQLYSTSPVEGPEAEAILVREVMLTEYTLLSSSDTLQGALERTLHSLQDVFPVVRGDRLVGSIARPTITERLLVDGNSYLQGSMTRGLQMAGPDERLMDALGRSAALGASEFIPVVEDGAMIGILTPQSLPRAVQQVKLSRPMANVRDRQ